MKVKYYVRRIIDETRLPIVYAKCDEVSIKKGILKDLTWVNDIDKATSTSTYNSAAVLLYDVFYQERDLPQGKYDVIKLSVYLRLEREKFIELEKDIGVR